MTYQWKSQSNKSFTVCSPDFVPVHKILSGGLAGSWDKADRILLDQEIFARIRECSLPEHLEGKKPSAVILPHAGYDYSLSAASYVLKMLRNFRYEKVIILGPSHRVYLPGQLCVPDRGEAFAVPGGNVPVDREGITRLKKESSFVTGNDSIHETEHSLQVLLPMLRSVLGESFTVLPVITGVLSDDDACRAGEMLRDLLTAETLLVISTDFTHYGAAFRYTPFRENTGEKIAQLDLGALDRITGKDLPGFSRYIRETGATICGEAPLRILLSLLGKEQKVEKLCYTNSAAESCDYSHCVSYLSAVVTGEWEKREPPSGSGIFSPEDQKILLGMARHAIAYVFEHRKAPAPDLFRDQAPVSSLQKCGCFVTLNLEGNLRGCIGEIEPCRSVYEAVTARAVDAAFRDPRFRQLTPGELRDVTIEISILTPSREISSYKEIRIGQHGMTLSLDGHSAVFLPQVAPEQGWSLEETLQALSLKAGLPASAWKDPRTVFTVFEAVVFHEERKC